MITNHYPSDDEFLPTRQSLLSRLKDWNDNESWYEFFQTYWRFIYKIACQAGLSDSDAQDVVQETIESVSHQMPNFQWDPSKGKFKGFLYKSARFHILDRHRKNKQLAERYVKLSPGSSGTDPIDNIIDPASVSPPNWDEEWERNLAQAALRNVKAKVKPKHFQIFDLYVLKQWPSSKVADTLSISAGQVFLAKHRITVLLAKEIQKLKPQYESGTKNSKGKEAFDSP